jgi:hypothetical protein
MAWKSFTGGVANIFPAAFQAVYVYETTSNRYQTLGAISGGVLNVQDFTKPDSKGRNKAISCYNLTAKCNMMQAALIEIELLDSLCNGTNSFLFKLSDAVTPAGAASSGWVYVSSAQVGVKARLNCSGTPDGNRQIELEWQGSILKSDANEIAMLKPTLAAASFCSSADSGTAVFYGIGTYTAATDGGSPTMSHIVPNGVSTLQLDGAGLSSPDTITPVTAVELTFDMLSVTDGLRRFLPCALEVNAKFDWMASGNADLLLLGNASQSDVKATITMIDSVVFTLDNRIGLETNFEVSGDMDTNRNVRLTMQGKDLQSALDTIAS